MPQNHKKKKHHKKNHNRNSADKNWIIPLDSSSQDEVSSCCSVSECNDLQNVDDAPFTVGISPIMGRYLIASRTIRPGELIIRDEPLVIGPTTDFDHTCIGCYIPLTAEHEFKCKGCGWTLCGPKCPGLKKYHGHSVEECSILRENRIADLFDDVEEGDRRLMYETLLPLRCLLLRDHDKERWEKLWFMESHNEIRKNIPLVWSRDQEFIVDRIRNSWKMKQFSEEEIHTVCGFIEVNCFEVGQNGAKARAMYINACLLAHDCRCNTTHTDSIITHELSIRATRPIKKGEAITLSYGYLLQGTLKRREFLNEGKFFWCQCERCTDPTELGTHSSSLRCPKCKDGIIISDDPLNQNAVWNCSNCPYHLTSKLVSVLVERIYGELQLIEPNDVDEMEKFLAKYRNVLHKNHYLFLSAKHTLCQLYGRFHGYLIQDLSSDQLRRKEEYCRDLLDVVDILEPGMSRLRGVVMYELHAPIMIQAARQFENKKIDLKEFKRKLREVIALLRESEKILTIEPEDTPEYAMATAARDALIKIGHV